MLTASCLNQHCASGGFLFGQKRSMSSECDAIKSCRRGFTCCFDGCRNICRHRNAVGGGGGGLFGNLFGNSVGKMDNQMLMMMMAAAGS